MAETRNALDVTEHNQPTRIYSQQANIAMAFLEPSDHTSLRNDKGNEHYVSISLTGRPWKMSVGAMPARQRRLQG